MSIVPPHPLEPDLAVIREFAKLDTHDQRQEARAAIALYEDACWRAAMMPLPVQAAEAVAQLEADAAALTRRYVAGDLDPVGFWQGFGALVTAMDQALGGGLAKLASAKLALDELRSLRERLAAAGLPPSLRRPAQATLSLMDAEVTGLLDGMLPPEDFDRLMAAGRATMEQALAAPPLDAQAQRLHGLRDRVAKANLPGFVRRTARDLLKALETAAPDKVDGLIAQVDKCLHFGDDLLKEETAALMQFRALESRALGLAAAPLLAVPLADQLDRMRTMLRQLDDGEYALGAFHADFAEQLRRLSLLLTWQDALEATDAR